ncbi:MAG: hypothetical protein AB7I27_00880 [Bacteriovoracaceae bacterium]
MKNLKQGLLLSCLLLAQPVLSCTENGSEGFVPENNLRIPVGMKGKGGITKAQFDAVIDKVEGVYSTIVSSMGGKLAVERNWDDETVNAYAMRTGSTWQVAMFGGLARHEAITKDGFSLVICHEIGHHIGGAPKKIGYYSSSWASNEGQADYFATLKCLRRVWMNDNNTAIVKKLNAPESLVSACTKQWANATDRAICIRGGMAGDSVARLFQALRQQPAPAKFETPDPKVVTRTNDAHPDTQCRLDTYFQGALCEVSFNDDVSNSSEVTGTCHASTGQKSGLRPLCWFKPSVQ